MANFPVKNGSGADIFLAATGTGTDPDPYTPRQNVHVHDQVSRPINFHFSQIVGPPTTLTVATAVGDKSVTVTSTAGFSVGNLFGTFSGARFYFGRITALPGGNVVNLDTPLDAVFGIGSTAAAFITDMSVDGSSTSQTFQIEVGSGGTESVDITRITYLIRTATTPEFSDFGDITGGLAQGVVLRRVDGTTENIDTFKDNVDFTLYSGGDLNLFSSGGFFGGTEGFSVRTTFAGQDKRGVAIRLAPGDKLELIIQDNLTSLTSFVALAQGHIAETT